MLQKIKRGEAHAMLKGIRTEVHPTLTLSVFLSLTNTHTLSLSLSLPLSLSHTHTHREIVLLEQTRDSLKDRLEMEGGGGPSQGRGAPRQTWGP